MDKQKAAKKLTFHSCLLQVVQNRTEDLREFPKAFRHGVKHSANRFTGEVDKFLGFVYPACNDKEIEQGMNLINLIADKLDEAFAEYEENLKQTKDESQITTSDSESRGADRGDSESLL